MQPEVDRFVLAEAGGQDRRLGGLGPPPFELDRLGLAEQLRKAQVGRRQEQRAAPIALSLRPRRRGDQTLMLLITPASTATAAKR